MDVRFTLPTGALALAVALPLVAAQGQNVGTSTSRAPGPTESESIVWDSAMSLALPTPPRASGPTASLPVSVVPLPGESHDLPKPFAAFSAGARSLGDSLVALARAQIGQRYRFGGASPQHGFDCSGLVRYVLAALHIDVPRTAREQAHAGATVPLDRTQLKPGDLVTFGSATQKISHIGIYVGDGRFVQASSRAGRVIETPLDRRLVHGAKPWRGARRVTPADDSTRVMTQPPDVTLNGLEY